MCSSLLGLGGTHVQQCSECRISRICVPNSRIPKRNCIAASYQHHAGLQPANLVTVTTVLRSRRSDLCVVYQYMLQQPVQRLFLTLLLCFIPYFVFFRPFTTELQYGLPTSVTYRTKYFRTLNSTWRTVRTCSCPIFMPDLRYALWRQVRTVRDNSVKLSVNQ